MHKAVLLAAGRGTRMRRCDPSARLDRAQMEMADRGLKGLIPFHGHPYLSYVLSALADAGFSEVCLVVGPGADAVRSAYEGIETHRSRISFAVQQEPLGSANALLSAERFAGEDPFLVLNADNYYPDPVLERMRAISESGLAGFRRETLVAEGNIPPERVAAYALVTTDPDGYLARIVEKPVADDLARLEGGGWVSMTCWRFGPAIFEACRSIDRSVRGEYEIPDAVMYAVESLGERFRVVPAHEPVLDLSRRADVEGVGGALRGIKVRL